MDIAKYIGLFLLKNHFSYIHGLGNLELKKKPATHDGQALKAPEYEVLLTPTGSIDDSLANFIATHEQTSISKASNALRDFSIQARADLLAGKEVEIPSMGKFVEENGKIRFITNPHLQYTPPSIPALRTDKRVDEAPSFKTTEPADSSYSSTAGINTGKIILLAAIVIGIILAAFFGIRYFNNQQAATPAPVAAVKDTTALVPPVAAVADTAIHRNDSAVTAPVVTPPPASAGPAGMRVILNSYPTRMAAERRVKTLTGNGQKVELVAKDSGNYLVVLPVTAAPADTAKLLDSLRRFYNPKGVSIYR